MLAPTSLGAVYGTHNVSARPSGRAISRWVSVPVLYQTDFLPAPAIPSSTKQAVWDAPQIPDHSTHSFDAIDPFDGYLGLEFTTEILTLRITHNPLYLQQTTVLLHCPENEIHYSGTS